MEPKNLVSSQAGVKNEKFIAFSKRKYCEGIWFTHIMFQQSRNISFWVLCLGFCIVISAGTYVALKQDTQKKVKIFIAQANTSPHWSKTAIKHCDNFLTIFHKMHYVAVKYQDVLKSTVSGVWKENKRLFLSWALKTKLWLRASAERSLAWPKSSACPT